MRTWVDTDFGFDDLWALLLLKHFDITIDGVSLVAGNAPLTQVTRNAQASLHAFKFGWPVFSGAVKPIHREAETAERILGKYGMCSRGRLLPYDSLSTANQTQSVSAIDAMDKWLAADGPHHIIALGPLTNLATLLLQHPETATKINQITWLGGSRDRGNHSRYAEYNALADPEALALVAATDIPFRMIDLELCRQVSFAETDMPTLRGTNQHLLADLLGGYLDIALQRGRSAMSIYDPLAALSVARADLFEFVPASLAIDTNPSAKYGRTNIDIIANNGSGNFDIAVSVDPLQARHLCLSALVDA